MNFQQLVYLITLEQEGHFGIAAEQCGVSQATLSAMIKRLEEDLSTQIFDRSVHPIRPTEEGAMIIGVARQILALKKSMYGIAHERSDKLLGDVHLAIIPTVANSLLPLVLLEVKKEHPALKLRISELTTVEIVRALKNGQVDFGIMATPYPDKELLAEVMYYEPMMVYGAKYVRRKYIMPSDLNDQLLWALEEGHCFKEQSLSVCKVNAKAAKTPTSSIVIRCN